MNTFDQNDDIIINDYKQKLLKYGNSPQEIEMLFNKRRSDRELFEKNLKLTKEYTQEKISNLLNI